MGLFASPNSAAIMNALPAEYRGVGSGMRSTFSNAGSMLSMGLFFSIMIAGLAQKLPQALQSGLTEHGVPLAGAIKVSQLPPTSSLFAALLGYNPLQNLLQQFGILQKMPVSQAKFVIGQKFFPSLIGPTFMHGLKLAFAVSLTISLVAAIVSIFRGQRYVHVEETPKSVPKSKLRRSSGE